MKAIVFLAALALCGSVFAQEHNHDQVQGLLPHKTEPSTAPAHDHGDHAKEATNTPQQSPGSEHANHDEHASTPEVAVEKKGSILYYKNPMGDPDTSQVPKKDSMGMDYIPVYESDLPPTITDHAADRFFDPAKMVAARALLKSEHGGAPISLLIVNILELQSRKGNNGYRWEGEGWYGGDLNRAVVKFKGEGELGGAVENAEVQTLYARAIGPYFNLQAGVRYDVRSAPSRAYATFGVEGLAPYWFELGAAAFVSNKGDVHWRLEGYYDLNVTQRLILQPRAEIDGAAQDVPELGTGAGISSIEAELRLRYEVRREFAPYIGISFERKMGGTAALARAAGERTTETSFVAGLRMFF